MTYPALVLAGVATGLVGYLTGLASLVSYPALLAAGLSPVAANVTNSLALVGIGIGSTARSAAIALERGRRHLAGQVAISAVGGLTGAVILLTTGEGSFEAIVPWLIAAASIALLVSPRLRRLSRPATATATHSATDTPTATATAEATAEASPEEFTSHDTAYRIGLFAVSVYCGYFGAGAGTIYLAFALIVSSETFERAMILKSALLGVTNLIAALVFVAYGPVDWGAAIALGVGCLVGGNLAPLVQRRLPPEGLRRAIDVAGLGLAGWLWLRHAHAVG